jgi:cytoskeletal protein CcmA (bactofilin family)
MSDRNAKHATEGGKRSMEIDGIVKEDKTTINSSTTIDGNIKAKEHLIINGRIKGNVDIEGYNLFLGPGGRLEGEVRSKNVKIRGHMKGDIIASGTVEIANEAHFSGNIKSNGISVEQGAYFDALVNLGKKPSEPATPQKTPTEKPKTTLV